MHTLHRIIIKYDKKRFKLVCSSYFGGESVKFNRNHKSIEETVYGGMP